jgi:hypothetical protein
MTTNNKRASMAITSESSKRMSMSFKSTAFMFPSGNFDDESKISTEPKKKSIKQGLLNLKSKLFKGKQDPETIDISFTKPKTPTVTPQRSPKQSMIGSTVERKNTLGLISLILIKKTFLTFHKEEVTLKKVQFMIYCKIRQHVTVAN